MNDVKKTAAAAITLLGGSGGVSYGTSKILQSKDSSPKQEERDLVVLTPEENEGNSEEQPVTPPQEESSPEPSSDQLTTVAEQAPAVSPQVPAQPQPQEESVPEDKKVSLFLKNAKFEVLPTQENKELDKWDKVSLRAEPQVNQVVTGNKFKKECSSLLEKNYDKTSKSVYIDTVKKCTKLDTLEERAKNWELVVFGDDDYDGFEAKWTEIIGNQDLLDDLKISLSLDDSEVGTDNYNELANRCDEYSKKFDSFSADIDKKWKNYLSMCIKSGDNLENLKTKSYWTNEPTTVE